MSAATELYQDLIMTRAREPRHGTRLACFDTEAEGHNPMCGDRLTLQVLRDPQGAIEAVGFEARGCAISIASADLMADAVAGLDRDAVTSLAAGFRDMVTTGAIPRDDRFVELASLAGVHEFRARVRCATLAWSALEHALSKDAR